MQTAEKIAHLLVSPEKQNRYIGGSLVITQELNIGCIFDAYKKIVYQKIYSIYKNGEACFISGFDFEEWFNYSLFNFSLNGWVFSSCRFNQYKELEYQVVASDGHEMYKSFCLESIGDKNKVWFNDVAVLSCIDEFVRAVSSHFSLSNLENI